MELGDSFGIFAILGAEWYLWSLGAVLVFLLFWGQNGNYGDSELKLGKKTKIALCGVRTWDLEGPETHPTARPSARFGWGPHRIQQVISHSKQNPLRLISVFAGPCLTRDDSELGYHSPISLI
ncbi:hypothetical protein VNO77_03517 [Canavalia gladiata]|uniref:Uncharacterized protein n=1 Tax=Canavalia gladiata TaxID=3824 RepID=A0AAN9MVG8_CANGL